jgi:hypothetical protein
MNPQLVEGRVDAAETITTHPAPHTLQQSRCVREIYCCHGTRKFIMKTHSVLL